MARFPQQFGGDNALPGEADEAVSSAVADGGIVAVALVGREERHVLITELVEYLALQDIIVADAASAAGAGHEKGGLLRLHPRLCELAQHIPGGDQAGEALFAADIFFRQRDGVGIRFRHHLCRGPDRAEGGRQRVGFIAHVRDIERALLDRA